MSGADRCLGEWGWMAGG